MTIDVRFWGVRGSIATPGPHTAAVGGNTSCVEVRAGERRIVLDAGTGLRDLGNAVLATGNEPVTLLLSHLHWDHIQGLPFYTPLYVPGSALDVYGPAGTRDALGLQMSSPVFPVRFGEVGARVTLTELGSGSRTELGDVRIAAAKLNHPGGVLGYRIEHRGTVLVYATDVEHYACTDPALVTLARGADLLIYDAQYLPEEYPSKVGWGHSTYEAGAALAQAAGVSALALFHHDPRRDDAEVSELEARAQSRFERTFAAREGQTLELGPAVVQAA